MGYLDADQGQTGNFVADHWHGRHSLPRAYWINGLLIAGVGGAFIAQLIQQVASSGISLQLASVIGLTGVALALAISIWSAVGIWRSANYHPERGGGQGWASLAKALVVLGLLGLTGQLSRAAPGFVETAKLASNNDPLGAPAEILLDSNTMTLRGPIAQGTAAKVAAVLADHDELTALRLTSEGGRMGDAIQIAALVKQKSLNTEARGVCNSACTLILLAGAERSIAAGSRVGFHQPHFPGIEPDEQAAMIGDLEQAYLEAGLPGSFIRQAMAEPADGMWYPSESELFRAKVLNKISRARIVEDNIASANAVNAKGPTRLDAITTLRSAAARGEELAWRYEVAADRDQFDRGLFELEMRRANKQEICAKPLIPEFILAGARYRFTYLDLRGATIGEVLIDRC